eukprot:1159199-Pyramimonas_sp.AAC.1
MARGRWIRKGRGLAAKLVGLEREDLAFVRAAHLTACYFPHECRQPTGLCVHVGSPAMEYKHRYA